MEAARKNAGNTLADEKRRSYPIPMRDPDGAGLFVTFLFSPSHLVPREGQYLMPPDYRADVDARSSKLLNLKKISPVDFGIHDPPGKNFGAHVMPPGMDLDEFERRQNLLYHHYDLLIPLFAAKAGQLTPADRAVAAQFKTLFDQLSEAPTRPYYLAAGKDFFDWVDRSAAQP